MVPGDVGTGVGTPEVGDVAVCVFWVVEIFEPLLQLFMFADLVGSDTESLGAQGGGKGHIDI